MRRFDCAEVIDVAPELAVGNLSGEERAAALTHLAGCPSCQHAVSSLTTVTDVLLQLAPRVEPSPGFEQRVLAALAPQPSPLPARRRRHQKSRRWGTAITAAAALVIALIAGGLLLDIRSAEKPAFASAQMRTASGDVVGEVFVLAADRTELFMTLPRWSEQVARYDRPEASYTLRVTTSDGDTTTSRLALTAEASWASTLDLDAAVTSVALIDDQGQVWCQAELEPPDNS